MKRASRVFNEEPARENRPRRQTDITDTRAHTAATGIYIYIYMCMSVYIQTTRRREVAAASGKKRRRLRPSRGRERERWSQVGIMWKWKCARRRRRRRRRRPTTVKKVYATGGLYISRRLAIHIYIYILLLTRKKPGDALKILTRWLFDYTHI